LAAVLTVAPAVLGAQRADSVRTAPHYWKKFMLGVVSSVLLHEAAHISASLALGGDPSFGFDTGRPTVYSGIDSRAEPRKQFFFSMSGLATQSVLDEAILDLPHRRGGAFERGLLGGGLGTTVFYLTIGRRGSVSDIDFMARTGVMSKTELTVLFGGIVAAHSWRIARDPAYDHFFVRPRAGGGMEVGLGWRR
jgi:hypothetical protein